MLVIFPITLGRLFYLSEYQVFISKTEIIIVPTYWGSWGFPGGSVGKESAYNAGDTGRRRFIPQVGKIFWRRTW